MFFGQAVYFYFVPSCGGGLMSVGNVIMMINSSKLIWCKILIIVWFGVNVCFGSGVLWAVSLASSLSRVFTEDLFGLRLV